jgi:putative NIF3 family GTP cyclohydrolase 1 type 2
MLITRRSVLVGATAIAATAAAEAFDRTERNGLTAQEVVNRIKSRVGIPWRSETVDRIVAGSPDTPVNGMAVTMMATLDVLQRAVSAGKNMVITHEPTFYSHTDATEALLKDPTFQLKSSFINAHQVVVFRFHDHWHSMTPDGVHKGMTRELGWEANADKDRPSQFVFPESSLADFATAMATRLQAHSMRIVGDPQLKVRRVVTNWGYASLMPSLIETVARPDINLIIVGETREWELVEYVQDQVTSGAPKALIVLNHVVSEQAGMKYCAEWLKPSFPELPVQFVPTREPFWVPSLPR